MWQQQVTENEQDLTTLFGGFGQFIPESWHPYWQQIQQFPLLSFVILTLLGYVVAKLAVLIFSKSFNQLTKLSKNEVDDQLIEILKRPIFLTLFFLFLGMAIKTIDLSAGLEKGLIRFLASILVLVWMFRGFKILTLLLNTLSKLTHKYEIIQPKTIPLFDLVGKLLLIGLGSYILLLLWGVDPTAWLASAGVIGIAVGFAAKDTLANLFSGFFIIADTPYKVGDYVNLDSGERGMVTQVGMRSTRLLTRDDIEITIPNNIIGNAKIVNETGGRWEKSRVRIPVGVAYGADVRQVCEVLKACAVNHKEVLNDPEPRVRMRSFGASSLDFELLCWINEPVLRGRLRHELFMDVYEALNEAGIEIPFSQHDLYIKELPATHKPPETSA
ncbi:MAG: mechanosensitive ion channel family protein [Proteobacteria bacterium]|nr:MAG: mechanosensitive ion channel family protein [Pseudomonadota bacterium]